MKKMKVNWKEGQRRLTADQYYKIRTEWEFRSSKLKTIRSYYEADNYEISRKAQRHTEAPNNKVPLPYGRLLATVTTGFMLTKDPEIVIKDTDQKIIDDIIKALGGYVKLKDSLEDCIIYGIGYNLIYQSDVDTKGLKIKCARLDPLECIAVYDSKINSSLVAVVRFYTVDDVDYTDIWYKDAFAPLTRAGSPNGEEVPHLAGRVPVSIAYANKSAIGVIQPVIPLIDALDKVTNIDLDEIEKFSMSMLLGYGVSVDPESIDEAKKGAMLEIESTVEGSNPRIEYLQRDINDTFHSSTKRELIEHIHKLSQVPDFADPSFAAESGVALEYKLQGFENMCGGIEKGMAESLKDTLEIADVMLNKGNSTLENADIWITFNRNLPRDDQYKMAVAESMKRVGLSKDVVLPYLSDYIDNIDKEKQRQEEESSLFSEENYYEPKNTPRATEEDTGKEPA